MKQKKIIFTNKIKLKNLKISTSPPWGEKPKKFFFLNRKFSKTLIKSLPVKIKTKKNIRLLKKSEFKRQKKKYISLKNLIKGGKPKLKINHITKNIKKEGEKDSKLLLETILRSWFCS